MSLVRGGGRRRVRRKRGALGVGDDNRRARAIRERDRELVPSVLGNRQRIVECGEITAGHGNLKPGGLVEVQGGLSAGEGRGRSLGGADELDVHLDGGRARFGGSEGERSIARGVEDELLVGAALHFDGRTVGRAGRPSAAGNGAGRSRTSRVAIEIDVESLHGARARGDRKHRRHRGRGQLECVFHVVVDWLLLLVSDSRDTAVKRHYCPLQGR